MLGEIGQNDRSAALEANLAISAPALLWCASAVCRAQRERVVRLDVVFTTSIQRPRVKAIIALPWQTSFYVSC